MKTDLIRIEHVNLTVPNLIEAIAFLSVVFPDFRERCRGTSQGDCEWLHFGNDYSYFALEMPFDGGSNGSSSKGRSEAGVNHIGFEVADLGALADRLRNAGHEVRMNDDRPYRMRGYVEDPQVDGLQWEFVEPYHFRGHI